MEYRDRNPTQLALALFVLPYVLLVVVIFSPVLAVIGVVVFLLTWRRRQIARESALLWALAAAAERFIPLVPAIEAFADEQRGMWSRRARYLAHMLRLGVPLPEAVQRSPGVIPREAVPLVRIGYESGNLAPALRQAAAASSLHSPELHSLTAKLVYLCTLPIFFLLIATFVFNKIVPAYRKIFQDFDTELPERTKLLFSVADAFSSYWYLSMPLFFALVAVAVYVLLRYTGWVTWNPPGIQRLARRYDTAAILDALALVAESQRPMTEGLATLARTYPSYAIRRRLQLAWEDVTAGADWREALLARQLINRADFAVLGAASRVGNLGWALRELADSSRRRLTYRLHALVQVLFPLAIGLVGLTVMFFVVGLFMPLVALIQNLTG
ncbi:MAG: type II secretion system F family protein [Planctomycetia bacterium]|nr:type II secretion system F family protein [Planctomycetia bacterium]